MKIYRVLAPNLAWGERNEMLRTINRLHRVLVDRLAGTGWLRDRAGANASWAHYERHAKAWRRASDRHAAASARASARAGKWGARNDGQRVRDRHAASRQRARDRYTRITATARRLAERGPLRALAHGQARLGSNHVRATQKDEDAR
jgi:hypothetical protein